jgi:hypothetical protein
MYEDFPLEEVDAGKTYSTQGLTSTAVLGYNCLRGARRPRDERLTMEVADFKTRCPNLLAASITMFYDGGGSSFMLHQLDEDLYPRILPQISDEDLLLAEAEYAALDDNRKSIVTEGEYWDQMLVASATLNWVLNMLFGEDALDKEQSIACYNSEKAAIPADYKLGENSGMEL